MNNNQSNNRGQQNNGGYETKRLNTKDQLLKDLMYANANLNVSGLQYTERTSDLAAKIEELFRNEYNLEQLHQVGIKPYYDRKTNVLMDLDITFYFNTDIRTTNNLYITRGRGNNNQNNQSQDSLLYARGGHNNVKGGGYTPSPEFVALMANAVIYDPKQDEDRNNNNKRKLQIGALDKNPRFAVLRMDPISVLEVLLGITENSPFSVNPLSAYGLGNSYDGEYDDYMITIIKVIEVKQRKKKMTMDCTQYDRNFNRNRGHRNNNGNRRNDDYNNRSDERRM